MLKDPSHVIFALSLLCGAIIAVRHYANATSITMLISAASLVVITAWYYLLFDLHLIPESPVVEWFPFGLVARLCEIVFGVTFICFTAAKGKTVAT